MSNRLYRTKLNELPDGAEFFLNDPDNPERYYHATKTDIPPKASDNITSKINLIANDSIVFFNCLDRPTEPPHLIEFSNEMMVRWLIDTKRLLNPEAPVLDDNTTNRQPYFRPVATATEKADTTPTYPYHLYHKHTFICKCSSLSAAFDTGGAMCDESCYERPDGSIKKMNFRNNEIKIYLYDGNKRVRYAGSCYGD